MPKRTNLPEEVDGAVSAREAGRRLGVDWRTVIRYGPQLGMYRFGREYRIPVSSIQAVRDNRLTLDPSPQE